MRLRESLFVSLYLADTVCFKDRLAEVWRRSTDGSEFGPLLGLVADGVRRLHDSGCTHGDLGNQNIELVRDGGGFSGIAFLDLNRARFGRRLSIGERAGDLVRIHLPYGLYDDFFRLYWRGEVPAAFLHAYRLCRFFFKLPPPAPRTALPAPPGDGPRAGRLPAACPGGGRHARRPLHRPLRPPPLMR